MKTLLFVLLIFLEAFPSCDCDQGPVGPEGPEGLPGSGIGCTNDPSVGYGRGGTFMEAASVTFEITEPRSRPRQ